MYCKFYIRGSNSVYFCVDSTVLELSDWYASIMHWPIDIDFSFFFERNFCWTEMCVRSSRNFVIGAADCWLRHKNFRFWRTQEFVCTQEVRKQLAPLTHSRREIIPGNYNVLWLHCYLTYWWFWTHVNNLFFRWWRKVFYK